MAKINLEKTLQNSRQSMGQTFSAPAPASSSAPRKINLEKTLQQGGMKMPAPIPERTKPNTSLLDMAIRTGERGAGQFNTRPDTAKTAFNYGERGAATGANANRRMMDAYAAYELADQTDANALKTARNATRAATGDYKKSNPVNGLDRIGNTLLGAGKQSVSAYTNAAGTAWDADMGSAKSNTADLLKSKRESLSRMEAAYRDDLSSGILSDGEKKDYERMIESMRDQVKAYEDAVRGQKGTAGAVYDVADTMSQSGTENIGKAKDGLGKVGSFAVDVGAAGTQMAADVILGGGSAMLPMALRSFGGGTQQARQGGATLNQQLAYGAGSAALSVLTEKIANVATPFQKIYGKGVLDDAISKVTGKLTSTAAGKLALSALSEGGEEVLENALSTVLQKVTYDKDAKFDLGNALYDGLVGAALGGIGGAVDVVANGKTTAPTETRPETPTPQQPQVRTEMSVPKAEPPAPTPVDIATSGNQLTRSQVNNIISNKPLSDAFTTATGIQLTGSNATKRNAIIDYLNSKHSATEQVGTTTNSDTAIEPVEQQSTPETSVGAATAGFEGDTERGFSKNLASDQARDPSIQEDYQLDPEMYHRLANKDTLQKATDIFSQGQEHARAQLEQAIGAAKNGMKLSPEMVPLAKMVADKLAADGDIDSARRILSDVALELTTAGQLGQAAAILRDAGPATRLQMVEKAVQEINKSLADKYGKAKSSKSGATISTDQIEEISKLLSGESDVKESVLRSISNIFDATNTKRSRNNGIPVEQWRSEIGSKLQKNLESRLSSKGARQKPVSQIVLDDLVKFAEEHALPKRKKSPGRTAIDRITDFYANRSAYIEAWKTAQSIMKDKYKDNPAVLDAFDEWIDSTISYNADPLASDAVMIRAIFETSKELGITKKQIGDRANLGDSSSVIQYIFDEMSKRINPTNGDSVILRDAISRYVNDAGLNSNINMQAKVSDALRDIGIKASDLIRKGAQTKEEIGARISEMLVSEYGISEENSKAASEMFLDAYNSFIEEKTLAELNRKYGEKAQRSAPKIRNKLQELSAMGAFSNPDFSEAAVRDVIGMDGFSLTAEEIKRITSLDDGDTAGFEQAYKDIAKRIGKEMPSTTWEKLSEFRRVAMLMNPRTQVRNVVTNVPLMLERKVAEKISGSIQDFLVKRGKLSKADQTRTRKVDSKSKSIASELYDTHKDTLLNGANKWDMSGMLREYRKYFGDSKAGQAMDAVRSFTYMLLEQGDQPFFRNAFLDSAAQSIAAQGYESMDSVPQSVIDYAAQQAMEATFKDASALANYINQAKKNGGVGGAAIDILFPFTTTPINIAKRSADYSPAGIIKAISDLNKGKTTAAIDDIARALTGTAVMGTAILLAKMGLITGAADDDKDKAAFDRQNGKLPFAFGGKVTYEWAQPFAAQLAVGAAVYEAIRDKDGWSDIFLDAIKVTGDTMAEMTIFKTVKDLLQGYGSTTDNIMNATLNGLFGQMVPSVVGATARSMDDTVRSSVTNGNALDKSINMVLAKTPVASKSLPAAVDTWGNDIKRIQNPIGRTAQEFLNPANISIGTYDAIDSEIERLYDSTGKKSVYPRTAPYDFDGEKLTGEERAKFQRTQGNNARNFVTALSESETYKSSDELTKVKQVERAHAFAEAIARNEYDPDYDGGDWAKAIEAMKSGVDPAAFFMVDAELKMRDKTPGTTSMEYAQAIESSNSVADEYKGQLWQLQNSSWSPEKNPYTGTMAKAGINTDKILSIMEKESSIYTADNKADSKDKGMEFSKYLDSLNLSEKQRQAVDGLYKHSSRAYDYKTMSTTQQKMYDWAKNNGYSNETLFLKYYNVVKEAKASEQYKSYRTDSSKRSYVKEKLVDAGMKDSASASKFLDNYK